MASISKKDYVGDLFNNSKDEFRIVNVEQFLNMKAYYQAYGNMPDGQIYDFWTAKNMFDVNGKVIPPGCKKGHSFSECDCPNTLDDNHVHQVTVATWLYRGHTLKDAHTYFTKGVNQLSAGNIYLQYGAWYTKLVYNDDDDLYDIFSDDEHPKQLSKEEWNKFERVRRCCYYDDDACEAYYGPFNSTDPNPSIRPEGIKTRDKYLHLLGKIVKSGDLTKGVTDTT